MIAVLLVSSALAAHPTPTVKPCVSLSGSAQRYANGIEQWVYSFPTCTPTVMPTHYHMRLTAEQHAANALVVADVEANATSRAMAPPRPTRTKTPDPEEWSVDPRSGLLLPMWAKDTRAGNPDGVRAWRAYWAVYTQASAKTPTATPAGLTHEQLRVQILALVDTIESDKKKAGSWNDEDEMESRWLRTWWHKPPATKTPTPNAEAACVKRGHQWTADGRTKPLMTWALINVCEGAATPWKSVV